MIPLIYTLVTCHIMMAIGAIYLHRGLSHRLIDFHPALEHVIRMYLWLIDGTHVKSWVATHRMHHRFTDVPGDPHSPQLVGLFQVAVVTFFRTMIYRYKNNFSEAEMTTYGSGTPDDWMERNIYCHQRLGMVLMLIINVLLFGRIGIICWLCQISISPLIANAYTTGILHWGGGYQHEDCKDASRNHIYPGLSLFIVGDQLHSNHHALPRALKLSCKWYEFDLSWVYIRILWSLGLLKPSYMAKL